MKVQLTLVLCVGTIGVSEDVLKCEGLCKQHMHAQQKHNVIWDASSYFSVKMTEIYVISTLNFK